MSGPADQTQTHEPATTEDPAPVQSTSTVAALGNDRSKPVNGPDSSPKAAGPSTMLRVRARYDAMPGSSKSGPKPANAESALWFDPLTIAPTSPSTDETINKVGVTRGGSQVIAHQVVPLHAEREDGAGEGTGTLTAQLKYAGDIDGAYTAKVTGEFKSKKARKNAQDFLTGYLGEKLRQNGDLEVVQTDAATAIMSKDEGAKDVRVTLATINDKKKLQDFGKAHVYYKARNNPTIGLHVPVVAVAERTITSGATTTKHHGTDVESEVHGDTKTNVVKVDDTKKESESHVEGAVQTSSETYRRENQRRYLEIVTKIQSRVEEMSQSLVKKAEAHSTYNDKGVWVEHQETVNLDDSTKDVTTGSKEGDKDEKNWAAYLEDALDSVSDVIDIPFIKDIPGVGKVVRKLNQFGLAIDLGKKVAKQFAVRGKVHFIDTKEHTEEHGRQHGTEDANGTHHRTVTRNDSSKATEDLKGKFTSMLTSVQTRIGTDTTTTDVTQSKTSAQVSGGHRQKTDTDDYKKTDTTTSGGGSAAARANQSTAAEMTWTQSVKEITTKPTLEATIEDGDGEVRSAPFGAPQKRPQ